MNAIKMTDRNVSETMNKAFALVTPERFGAKDWREPIDAYVTSLELKEAGITLEILEEAIAFFTSTRATHETVFVGNGPFLVFRVVATGYRNGPAGP